MQRTRRTTLALLLLACIGGHPIGCANRVAKSSADAAPALDHETACVPPDACVSPTCAVASWGTPRNIEAREVAVYGSAVVRIAATPSGNATVAWTDTRHNVRASRYAAQTGTWGAPHVVAASSIGIARSSLDLATTANGDTIAVWVEANLLNGKSYSVRASRLSVRSGSWDAPNTISTSTLSASRPHVAVAPTGSAIAVWDQSDGIWVSRFSARSGSWRGAQRIVSVDKGNANHARVVIDANNNTLVIWRNWDGTQAALWAKRFSASTGAWHSAQLIGAGLDNQQNPKAAVMDLAINAAGDAIAVWASSGTMSSGHRVSSNRFSAKSATWHGVEQLNSIETPIGARVSVAMSQRGDAVAVWSQQDSSYRYDLWTCRFSGASRRWGTPHILAKLAFAPRVAMAPEGTAVAVWYQPSYGSTASHVWAKRFFAGSCTWGPAQLIEATQGNGRWPQVALDKSGNAIAAWIQHNGLVQSVWANATKAHDRRGP